MCRVACTCLTSWLVVTELTSFKGRRVVAFRKNLIEMAELEIKHAKVMLTMIYRCLFDNAYAIMKLALNVTSRPFPWDGKWKWRFVPLVKDHKIKSTVLNSFYPPFVHRTTWLCCRDVSTWWRPTSEPAFPSHHTQGLGEGNHDIPRSFSCNWPPPPRGCMLDAVCKPAPMHKCLVRSMSPCLHIMFPNPIPGTVHGIHNLCDCLYGLPMVLLMVLLCPYGLPYGIHIFLYGLPIWASLCSFYVVFQIGMSLSRVERVVLVSLF